MSKKLLNSKTQINYYKAYIEEAKILDKMLTAADMDLLEISKHAEKAIDLSIQSLSGTLSNTDKGFLDFEFQIRLQEIARIASDKPLKEIAPDSTYEINDKIINIKIPDVSMLDTADEPENLPLSIENFENAHLASMVVNTFFQRVMMAKQMIYNHQAEIGSITGYYQAINQNLCRNMSGEESKFLCDNVN